MSAEELKVLFSQPLMLLVLMLVASLGSAGKQLIVARRQGPISVIDYFLRIETIIMLGTNVAAWLTLLYSDTLNIASALGAGYAANDSADVFTKDGRSSAISPPANPPGSGT